MKEALVFFVAIFVVPIALILGLTWCAVAWECGNYESATGKPTKMVGVSCYVQQDAAWMVWEEYVLRFATHGASKE